MRLLTIHKFNGVEGYRSECPNFGTTGQKPNFTYRSGALPERGMTTSGATHCELQKITVAAGRRKSNN